MKVTIPPEMIALLEATRRALEAATDHIGPDMWAAPPIKSLPLWMPDGTPVQDLKDLAAVLNLDEMTAAHVVLGAHQPTPWLLSEAKKLTRTDTKTRHVRDAAFWGAPVGTPLPLPKKPDLSSRKWSGKIMQAVSDNGGITLSLKTGTEPTVGYVVAERGNNLEIPEDEFFDRDRGIAAIIGWAKEHKEKLSDPSANLGIWYDRDHQEVCLDVSYVVDDKDAAIRLGQRNNQQAIWDIANMVEIDTGGSGDRSTKGEANVKGTVHTTTQAGRGTDRGGTPRVGWSGLGPVAPGRKQEVGSSPIGSRSGGRSGTRQG